MQEFSSTLNTIESAMQAQTRRLQIISENIANNNSTAIKAGEDPYRRKIIFFNSVYDRKTKSNIVKTRVSRDNSSFKIKYDPGHPSSINGYVSYANVDLIIENADMLESKLAYDANVSILSQTLSMLHKTLQLLEK